MKGALGAGLQPGCAQKEGQSTPCIVKASTPSDRRALLPLTAADLVDVAARVVEAPHDDLIDAVHARRVEGEVHRIVCRGKGPSSAPSVQQCGAHHHWKVPEAVALSHRR